MTTTALVHILQIEDVRYDIRAFGLKVMTELPAHMGVCPELDTAVSAVVTLYNSHLCKRSTVKGLTQYGAALAATSKLVKNPGQSPRFLIQALFMLHVCQVSHKFSKSRPRLRDGRLLTDKHAVFH